MSRFRPSSYRDAAASCFDSDIKKGPWKAEEDEVLINHVKKYGPREWSSIRSKGLLRRTGKSCRLRWVNKLRPNLKTGCKFSMEEERIVIELQEQFGNKWARIATFLPGRTDNDVKNFWSSRQKRLARILQGKASASSSSSPAKSQRPSSRNGGGGDSDAVQPLLMTWEPVNEASMSRKVQRSTYVDRSGEDMNQMLPLLPMPELIEPSLMNYNTNLLQLDLEGLERNVDVECPAADFPIQVPFAPVNEYMEPEPPLPEIPILPLPLSHESQEMVAWLETGGFMDALYPMNGMMGNGRNGEPEMRIFEELPPGNGMHEENPLAEPDSFFDDFPADMFDHIASLPCPSDW